MWALAISPLKNSSQANSAQRPAALTIAGALRAVTGSSRADQPGLWPR